MIRKKNDLDTLNSKDIISTADANIRYIGVHPKSPKLEIGLDKTNKLEQSEPSIQSARYLAEQASSL